MYEGKIKSFLSICFYSKKLYIFSTIINVKVFSKYVNAHIKNLLQKNKYVFKQNKV